MVEQQLAGEPSSNHCTDEVGQAQVVVAYVPPQNSERVLHPQLAQLRQHALGLFEDDPAGQRGLQLQVDRERGRSSGAGAGDEMLERLARQRLLDLQTDVDTAPR